MLGRSACRGKRRSGVVKIIYDKNLQLIFYSAVKDGMNAFPQEQEQASMPPTSSHLHTVPEAKACSVKQQKDIKDIQIVKEIQNCPCFRWHDCMCRQS